jgi:hypothetical protein
MNVTLDMVPYNLKFDINRAWRPSASGMFVMSDHAMKRMFERSFSPETVRFTLRHGEWKCSFMLLPMEVLF